MLAVGLSNGKLHIYDDHEPFCLRDKYAFHRVQIDSLAWSNNGKFIATVSSERIVYVWDALTLDLVVRIKTGVDRIISIAWSPEDNFINVVSVLGTYPTANLSIQSYCVNTSENLSSCSEESWNTSLPAVSQDNKFLALASPDGNVQVWDTSTVSLVAMVREHYCQIYSVLISRCSRFLVLGLYEGSIRVWDLDLQCRVTTIYDHEKAVYSLSWSHDERILASKSFDNTVRLWRCDTWVQLALIEERSFEQLEIACHPTREKMVTFNKRNTSLRLWTIDTNTLYQSNYTVKQVAETLHPPDQLIHILTKIDQRTEKMADQPSRVIHTQKYFEKVEGGYHEHNYAHEQHLAEAASEIQKLLDQLAITYPNSTETALVQAIQVEIEHNPTLKARLINALKSGGVEALKAIFNHPFVSVPVETIKGFLEAEAE